MRVSQEHFPSKRSSVQVVSRDRRIRIQPYFRELETGEVQFTYFSVVTSSEHPRSVFETLHNLLQIARCLSLRIDRGRNRSAFLKSVSDWLRFI